MRRWEIINWNNTFEKILELRVEEWQEGINNNCDSFKIFIWSFQRKLDFAKRLYFSLDCDVKVSWKNSGPEFLGQVWFWPENSCSLPHSYIHKTVSFSRSFSYWPYETYFMARNSTWKVLPHQSLVITIRYQKKTVLLPTQTSLKRSY